MKNSFFLPLICIVVFLTGMVFVSAYVINTYDYVGASIRKNEPLLDKNKNPIKWGDSTHYNHSLYTVAQLFLFNLLYSITVLYIGIQILSFFD